jgi:hypothetical protein
LGLFLWASLGGALFYFGLLLLLVLITITLGYSDTVILIWLGAREVLRGDKSGLFESATQEAYKLSLPKPKIYFYNGSLERAFVLQSGDELSLVFSKRLLSHSGREELSAICFMLLLQVKKGMATKRTRAMFNLGFISWIFHLIIGLIHTVFPGKDFRRSMNWLLGYLLHPSLELLHQLVLGRSYFKKIELHLANYPYEQAQLNHLGLKLQKPLEYYSLVSRKVYELSAINRNRSYQNMLALEFLPHEWEYFFKETELGRAHQA